MIARCLYPQSSLPLPLHNSSLAQLFPILPLSFGGIIRAPPIVRCKQEVLPLGAVW